MIVYWYLQGKKRCSQKEPGNKRSHEETVENDIAVEEGKLGRDNDKPESSKKPRVSMSTRKEQAFDMAVSYGMKQIPGHTGFLTFAVLYP